MRWNINTEKGSIMANKECRLFPSAINDIEFYAKLLVINGGRYNVVL